MNKKNENNSKQNNEKKSAEDSELENKETEIMNETNEENSIKEPDELIKNYEERIESLESQVNELKDKVLRRAAEFENYKRRTENDQINLIKYAAENFIIKLLPVVDDFERSLEHIDNSNENEPVKKGIQMVYDKLMKVLDEQGVKKIEAAGQPFDVNLHEAIMQRKAENVPPHFVLDEIEKGYMYKDRVIRHAKVIVSEENQDEIPNGTKESNNEEN
jgi:molecular chaperone GrpE